VSLVLVETRRGRDGGRGEGASAVPVPSAPARRVRKVMVRTPCAPNNTENVGPGGAKTTPTAPPEVLPACVEGCRRFTFEARKVGASPGQNAGSWKVKCQVRVKRKITFRHKWSLVFAVEDDVGDRDAECLDQLRSALAECWHRVTASPKNTCLLSDLGRDFSGQRYVKLCGEKGTRKQDVCFSLTAVASCAHGTYTRETNYVCHSEADAARTAATALLNEIHSTWAAATRTKEQTASAKGGNQENVPSSETPPRGVGARTLNYIRDVYGSASNVDSVIAQQARRRV